jgi:hypothetical protein
LKIQIITLCTSERQHDTKKKRKIKEYNALSELKIIGGLVPPAGAGGYSHFALSELLKEVFKLVSICFYDFCLRTLFFYWTFRAVII